MAVDTKEKRLSMLNFGDGTHVHATFEADGAVDADDRAHLLDLYSGVALSVAPASAAGQSDLILGTITGSQVRQDPRVGGL